MFTYNPALLALLFFGPIAFVNGIVMALAFKVDIKTAMFCLLAMFCLYAGPLLVSLLKKEEI